MVGVTSQTVQKVKRRYEETGKYLRRPGNGRPRRLAEATLKPRRPASGPKLEREHRVARLKFFTNVKAAVYSIHDTVGLHSRQAFITIFVTLL
ncbi:Transposable element Tcb2 transposase, partial [Operophtera brumata]